MRIIAKSLTGKAFTLMELLITISIIAGLAIIAVPSYNKYRVRSKAATMLTAATAAKLVVENEYWDQYSFTNINYSANSETFVTTSMPFISSIAIVAGVITVTGNTTDLGGRGIVLTLTPSVVDQSVVWACATNNTDFYEFVPEECRNAP